MKVFLVMALCLGVLVGQADAKGGSSSGGGHASSSGHSSGGFSSSSGRSMSSAPAPAPRPSVTPAPTVAQNPNKGSFSSTAPRPTAAAPAPATRTTTTTTTSTSTHTYSGRNVSPGGYYGGWGMGYGYSNGLMTGLIIGNMMHPYGSVMYAGPGMYANNALLYPNGQVVNQQGVLVGTYGNGVFSPISNGQVVAQAVPQDVQATPVQPQVVQLVPPGPTPAEIIGMFVLSMLCVIVFLAIVL